MAVFKSTIFSQIVNSVSGITFYAGTHGSIIGRTRVIPTDPKTADQIAARALFGASMAAWQNMTAAQRQTWEDFAAGTPWKNAVGDDVHLSGVNMFLSVRLAALQINNAIPDSAFLTAPCLPGLLPQVKIDIDFCTSGILQTGFKITVTNDIPGIIISLGAFISLPQNLTVNFWKGPYDTRNSFQVINVFNGAPKSQDVIGLTASKRYFLKFRVLDNTNQNNVSSPWHRSTVAQPCSS